MLIKRKRYILPSFPESPLFYRLRKQGAYLSTKLNTSHLLLGSTWTHPVVGHLSSSSVGEIPSP